MKKAFFLKEVFQIYRKVHIAECPGTHHPNLTVVSYVTLKKIIETVEYAFQTFSNLFFSPYPEVNTTLMVFILPFHIVGFYSTCNLSRECMCVWTPICNFVCLKIYINAMPDISSCSFTFYPVWFWDISLLKQYSSVFHCIPQFIQFSYWW